MLLLLLYSLLFPAVLGNVCLLVIAPSLSCFVRWGLAYGIGMGVISVWIFLLGAFNMALSWEAINIPLCVLLCFVFWRGRVLDQDRRIDSVRFSPDFVQWAFLAVIVINVMFTFFVATAYSAYSWDSIATIVMKSIVFFFERSFEFNRNLPHASYPIHVSLMHFWVAANFAQWNDTVINIVQPCFYGSLLLLMYGVLRSFVSSRYALVGVFLLATSALFQFHATIAYTDIVLAYYTCAAVWLVLLGCHCGSSGSFAAAGLCAALACFTKLEGVIYSLIVAGLCVLGNVLYREKSSWQKKILAVVKVGLPPVLMFSAYLIFKIVYGVSLGEAGKTSIEFSADFFHRLAHTVNSIRIDVFLSGNWGWNWLICIAGCALGFRSFRKPCTRYSACAVLAFLCFDMVLFLFTPNFRWIVSSTTLLSRLILQSFPLVPFLSAIVLEEVFSKRSAK
ncbi:MAG TPA: glycosyltransferase family 39 protein [Candidatus Omnitrophota bacterium]|nr:glycosyltransferase family 39 protein [Candidatus Omnitrophota bacterium]